MYCIDIVIFNNGHVCLFLLIRNNSIELDYSFFTKYGLKIKLWFLIIDCFIVKYAAVLPTEDQQFRFGGVCSTVFKIFQLTLANT